MYLEQRVAKIFLIIHAIAFVGFNVQAVLWHYKFI